MSFAMETASSYFKCKLESYLVIHFAQNGRHRIGWSTIGGIEMELRKLFLERLEAETAATRKVIERVPEGHNDWKPHEKSMALGYLAALVASMPGWVSFMIETDAIDFSDASSEGFQTK